MLRFINSPTIKISAGSGLLLLIFLLLVGFRADTLPHNPLNDFSDATISRWPDALHFQQTIRHDHTLPLWNPHLMGGQPFAANPGTKVWYPLTWLLILWNPALHINFMVGFHLWLGGLGMWLWARRTGLTFWPAMLCSVGYLFAPKLLAHAGGGHLDLLIAVTWLPFLLFFIHRLFIGTEYPSVDVIGLALVGAMVFIGAIQIAPFTFGLGATYAIFLATSQPTLKFPLRLLLGALLATGFVAVQWLPLIELGESVTRGDIREQDAAIFSVQGGQFLGLLLSEHGGSIESFTYVGVCIFMLAVSGLLRHPRQNRFWWGVILFAALYSMGENFILWSGLVKILPVLRLFRVPPRAWFLAALVFPYLAGWGLQFLIENPPRSSRARMAIIALCGIGISCSAASFVILSEGLKTETLIGLVAFPITAIVLALYIFEQISPRTFAFLLTLMVILDGTWVGHTLIEGRPPDEWLNESPPQFLGDYHGRLYTPSYAIPQQDTAFWGIARFDGVDPFQLQNFVENSELATGIPREGYSTTIPAEVVLEVDDDTLEIQNAPMNAEYLGRWGVRWVVTSYPIQIEGLQLAGQENEIFYFENQEVVDFALDWENANRVTQTVSSPQALTVTNAPGWQTAEGEAIDADSLTLPAENATFVYRPRGVYLGILISSIFYGVAGLWLLGVFGFLPVWWRR